MNVVNNVLTFPEKVCRICHCEDLNQVSLLHKIDGDSRTLCDMLSFLTNLNISLIDAYPKQICNKCFTALTDADQLKQRCILSENYLKESLLNLQKHSQNDTKHEIILSELPELYQCAVCYKKYSNLIDLEYHAFSHNIEKNDGSKLQEIDTKKTIEVPILNVEGLNIKILSKTEEHCVKEEGNIKNEYDNDVFDDMSCSDSQEDYKATCNCDASFESDIEYRKHVKVCEKKDLKPDSSKGVSIKLVCPKCNIDLPSIEALAVHVKKHKFNSKKTSKPAKQYECDQCMRKFIHETSLITHLKKHDENSQQKFVCKSCKREFRHEAHLDNHILQVHTRDRGFSCDCCDKNFTTLEALRVHKEIHKVEKKHQCKICKKSFIMLSSLTDHLRSHTGEKPYLCSTCGRGFSQKTNLEQHIRRHLGLKPFPCENCDKRFVSKGELVAHTRKHSGAHPFVCDDCGNGFTTSSSLVKHRRTHTGERPYSCDMCPMKFTASGTLKNHKRTHTGEKPYQCSFCEKAFVQKQDLTSHVRCHTGERPYVCNNCGQAFRKAAALKVHLKIHGKERDLLQRIHVQV